MDKPLLSVRNLRTTFRTDRGETRAVDGVSFSLRRGEILGLVGESGSGKSMTAMSIMRLVPQPPGMIEADELRFDEIDLLRLTEREMSDIRSARISMIFQDPMRSLNPVLSVGRQLTETVIRHRHLDRQQAQKRAIELLEMVGIPAAR